jgi:hypothetical protein
MPVNLSPELIVKVEAAGQRLMRELSQRLVGLKRTLPLDSGEIQRQPYGAGVQTGALCEVLELHAPAGLQQHLIGLWSCWTVSVKQLGAASGQTQQRRLDEFVPVEDLHMHFRRVFRGLPVPMPCARPQLYLRSGGPFVDDRTPQFVRAAKAVQVSPGHPLLLRPNGWRDVPQAWDALRVEISEDGITFRTEPEASHHEHYDCRHSLVEVVPEQSPYLVLKVGTTVFPVLKVRGVRRDLQEVELLPHRDVQAVAVSAL